MDNITIKVLKNEEINDKNVSWNFKILKNNMEENIKNLSWNLRGMTQFDKFLNPKEWKPKIIFVDLDNKNFCFLNEKLSEITLNIKINGESILFEALTYHNQILEKETFLSVRDLIKYFEFDNDLFSSGEHYVMNLNVINLNDNEEINLDHLYFQKFIRDYLVKLLRIINDKNVYTGGRTYITFNSESLDITFKNRLNYNMLLNCDIGVKYTETYMKIIKSRIIDLPCDKILPYKI